MLRETTIVNNIARNIPRTSAVLEYFQDEHQSTMIEIEGMIAEQPIFVLIDPGENLSYVSPQMVEKCKLKSEKSASMVSSVTYWKKKKSYT